MSAKTTVQVSQDVKDVLSSAVANGSVLKLTGTLDRKLYQEVDKVLRALQGKWNKKAGGHVFDKPAQDILDQILGNKELIDEKKLYQFYETPEKLARKMVDLARIKPGDILMEPSAGNGAICRFFPVGHRTIACEIKPQNPEELEKNLSHLNPELYILDFLTLNPSQCPFVHAVVMNPPFANGQDIAHVTHAFSFLAPGGVLVAIMSPAWRYRKGAKWEAFRKLWKECGEHQEDIAAGEFAESGTQVATVLVVLRRPGWSRF